MMTFSKTCVLSILAAVAMVGCATDEAPTDETEVVVNTLQDSSGQTIEIAVPPELSFHQFEKNDDEVGTLACQVKLLYCRDPRSTPRKPSYCHNAGCTEERAEREGRALCRSTCGDIDCSFMWDISPCP